MHEALPHAGKAAQYTSKFRAISERVNANETVGVRII
jgi:hypothetical protein